MSKSAEEILESLDLFADDQREHLLDAFDLARQKCPVVHTEADGGYHVVTRYDDVKTVCQKPDVFSSAQPGIRGVPVRLPPLDADLPLHRDFRRFLNQYFSRSFLLRYEDDMRTVARAAIVEFLDRGEVEFVHEFAIPFSAGSLARIVFATDNADLVARGVAAVHRTSVESTPETFTAVALLAMEAMAEVGDNPVGREDVLAGLVTAEVDGRPLTDEERLGVVTVLLLGGLDTTRGMITNIAFHLATRPGTEDLLQRPEWWRSDLDEFIRFEPTVHGQYLPRGLRAGGDPAQGRGPGGDRLHIGEPGPGPLRTPQRALLRSPEQSPRRLRDGHPPVPRPQLRPAPDHAGIRRAVEGGHELPPGRRQAAPPADGRDPQQPDRDAPRLRPEVTPCPPTAGAGNHRRGGWTAMRH
jgi:hypothetical protein